MANYSQYTYCHPDAAQYSEYSNSDDEGSYETSSSSCEDEYGPIWLEKVGAKGELFYIEPGVSVANTSAAETTPPKNDTLIKSNPKYSKNKAATKLKEWMKKRRKKQKKRHDHAHSDGRKEAKSCATDQAALAMFEQGKTVEVWLNVDISQHNYGRRATWTEKLFGFVATSNCLSDSDFRVLVKSITFNGLTSTEGTIKIGDWLKTVNDVEVTTKNLNAVLEAIASPSKVKLVFQQPLVVEPTFTPNDTLKNNFMRHVVDDLDLVIKLKTMCLNVPHGVYYFCERDENANDDSDDMVYRYPDLDNDILKQKGMFVTLNHMISDVGTPPVISCSLFMKNEAVHVGFVNEAKGLMVLALPCNCATVTEVEHFAVDISKLLKLQFSTLSNAFSDKDNADYLNSLFTMFFCQKLNSSPDNAKNDESQFLEILPSVHWFPLPTDLKIIVDDILCQYESADFNDTSEGFYDIRRVYNILGSCFFYKGYLLGSHLNKDDLLDVHLFLQCHKMISMMKTRPVSRVIIWKEIFPSRYQNKKTPSDAGYVEDQGRYFLLVLAIKYSLLATILEAGGCTHSATKFPSPDAFYVNLVENTVLLLEDSGIFSTVNKLLETQLPHIASPEMFLKGEKSNWEIFSSMVGLNFGTGQTQSNQKLASKRSQSYSNLLATEGNKRSLEASSVISKISDKDLERQQLLSNMGPADGESDCEASLPDDSNLQRFARRNSMSTNSNTGSQDSEDSVPFRGNKHIFSSSYDLRTFHSSQDCVNATSEAIPNLVAGAENTLFYYLHMDPAEGIFLAPAKQAKKWLTSTVAQEILQIFYKCCSKMRTMFERSLRNKELSNIKANPKFGFDSFLQAVYEQGAMFQYSILDGSQKKTLALNFWVIGRLFFAPEPREVYVCYNDSTEQNIVELAFRLGFGLTL